MFLNALNAELNHICHLLALLGARHILHIIRKRVNAWDFISCKERDFFFTGAPELHGHNDSGRGRRFVGKVGMSGCLL
jgi:hypothetical protein